MAFTRRMETAKDQLLFQGSFAIWASSCTVEKTTEAEKAESKHGHVVACEKMGMKWRNEGRAKLSGVMVYMFCVAWSCSVYISRPAIRLSD